jgi:hypothetical protein
MTGVRRGTDMGSGHNRLLYVDPSCIAPSPPPPTLLVRVEATTVTPFPCNRLRDRLPQSPREIADAAAGIHRGARQRGGVAHSGFR